MRKAITILYFLGVGLAAVTSLPSCKKMTSKKLLSSFNAPADGALVEIYS
jgi:hypothetical protein